MTRLEVVLRTEPLLRRIERIDNGDSLIDMLLKTVRNVRLFQAMIRLSFAWAQKNDDPLARSAEKARAELSGMMPALLLALVCVTLPIPMPRSLMRKRVSIVVRKYERARTAMSYMMLELGPRIADVFDSSTAHA